MKGLLLLLFLLCIEAQHLDRLLLSHTHNTHHHELQACLKTHLDSTTKITCSHSNGTIVDCYGRDTPGPLDNLDSNWVNPGRSWLARCIATKLVEDGFQLPVYVVHGGNRDRYINMVTQFDKVGIKNDSLIWITSYPANNLTTEDRKIFIPTRKNVPADQEKCREVLPHWVCSKGFSFNDKEISVALKHVEIISRIASPNSTRDIDKHFGFSLVIEDDQVLPRDILRQIIEIILQAPHRLGNGVTTEVALRRPNTTMLKLPWIVMLDDSFFFEPHYAPPLELQNALFPSSYARNNTRTCGAFLISHRAAKIIRSGTNLVPLYSPVDHQLAKALRSEHILTHWVIPPIACAGSQGMGGSSSTGGLVVDKGDRDNCKFCCNRYYNVTSMESLFHISAYDTYN